MPRILLNFQKDDSFFSNNDERHDRHQSEHVKRLKSRIEYQGPVHRGAHVPYPGIMIAQHPGSLEAINFNQFKCSRKNTMESNVERRPSFISIPKNNYQTSKSVLEL